ncbi:Neuromedin-B receptor [Zootermopsis nevadensis]|uniref:Neuromedin-B receptor n=1 Tax=Zootermopsis nevadensis TaxID=136037 RepID=A0A067R9M6_ZOONE|nr:Neuromedin-B receptor [Zootermopsis nevadensis]
MGCYVEVNEIYSIGQSILTRDDEISNLAVVFVLILPSGICGQFSGHPGAIKTSNASHYLLERNTMSTTNVQELLSSSVLPTNSENETELYGIVNNVTKDSADVDEAFQRFLLVKKYMDPLIMGIIFIFGAVANITLLVILVRHEEMRTWTNACIFTMATGDLLSVIVNIPLFYALLTSRYWTVGVVLCKLMWFFSDFAVGLSIFAVTMLSVQRYCGIVNTNIYIYSGRLALKSRVVSAFNILLIWVLSFGFAIRTVITTDVTDNICSSVSASYGSDFSKNIALLNLFMFCIIPLSVIAVFYGLTARYLVESARNMPGETSDNIQKIIYARKKGAKTVLALTGVFFVSYMPWYLWQVVFFWGNFSSDYKVTAITYTFLYYLFFGNLCFNPIALYCVSSAFRKYFNRYLFCYRKVKEEQETTLVKSKSTCLTYLTNTETR